MYISELISHLQAQLAEHGDLHAYRAADPGGHPVLFAGVHTHVAEAGERFESCDDGLPLPPKYLMVY